MTTTTAKPSEGAKTLQERLHILLSRLSATIDLIKTWPESDGDDASIHVETSSKLIASIREVISALEHVEGIVKADDVLRKALQDCPIPIDLLELLDHANGLNPGMYVDAILDVHNVELVFVLTTSHCILYIILYLSRLLYSRITLGITGSIGWIETTKISVGNVGKGSPKWFRRNRRQ
jgi:hypothetical protein